MPAPRNENIICRLKKIRNAKGLTQTQLAEQINLKRQAVYDMEAGRYLPNTSVALALARVLECRVEEIFVENHNYGEKRISLVEMPETPVSRVSIAKVRGRLYAYPVSGRHAIREEMNAADGLIEMGKENARMLKSEAELDRTALLLGCDPAFSILGQHVLRNKGNCKLHCRFASTSRSIDLLSAGQAHIAGIHLHSDDMSGANIAFAQKKLGNSFGGKLIAFSSFEEGFMVAPGNPKNISKPADLAEENIKFVNREKGAALRTLLDDCLDDASVPSSEVSGYDDCVTSHAEGAHQVLYGMADAALGLRVVAEAYHLDFVPVTAVRCDIVIPSDLMEHVAVQAVLDILQSQAMRDELRSLPGYDSTDTGKIIAEF